MKYNKAITIMILMPLMVIVLSSFNHRHDEDVLKFIVAKGSGMFIKGSTNVNTFSCNVTDYAFTDTITCTKSSPNKNFVVIMQGILGVSVGDITCSNALMKNDLRKTLKMQEYPTMRIQFISLNKTPELCTEPETINGLVDIELAGVTKRMEVSYTFTADENQVIHMHGKRCIKFTDFKLTPPKKLGGIIQTNNDLEVMFYLNLKKV